MMKGGIWDTGYGIRDARFESRITNPASRLSFLTSRISHPAISYPVSRDSHLACPLPPL
jgi:hypothetical protein